MVCQVRHEYEGTGLVTFIVHGMQVDRPELPDRAPYCALNTVHG